MSLQLSTNIGQRQSVVMTAQLQQAICLLQLSNLDLQSFIEKEAEENPFMEVAPTQSSGSEVPVSSMRNTSSSDQDFTDIGSRLADHELSLYGHVSAQFDLLFTNPSQRLIAEQFLEALAPNGWLDEPLEMIAMRCGIDLEQAEDMLHEIQQIEPAGLFARNLAECLSLQADDRGMMTREFRVLLDNLPMLAAANLTGLCRTIGCTLDELKPLLKQLRSLNPKPGADFIQTEMTEREPDLIVTRSAEGWRVDLNRSTLPSVLVDEEKAKRVCRDEAASPYVNDRLSMARWLRRAIEHRNQTTMAIGTEIARRQAKFLAEGPAFLAPMTLRDVADSIGVHESTVSRVTTGVMMVTPQGTFNLKRLFSTGLATDGENMASSASIRHRIQQLVRDEDPKAPLSDDAIAKIISDEGTHLARRTVAKYRDMLKIASSFERKRQAKLANA